MAAPSPPRALLFDLGGVVFDIDFGRALAAWQPVSALPPEALRAAFRLDAPYEQHETGHLATEAYFAHLRQALQLSASAAELVAGWNRIIVGEIAGTLALIDAIAPRVPCHAVTNTNAPHLAHLRARYPHVLGRFGRVFASHEMGLRKPDAACFAHVLAALGLAPHEALFLDDHRGNVEAAARLGLRTGWVERPQDVRGLLAGHGLA
jgi:FMN phosphatase YigB (HAD superfamily)